MDYKKIIITIIIIFNSQFNNLKADIIYNKDGITLTSIDLLYYQNILIEIGQNNEENIAKKKLILIYKTINKIRKKNQKFFLAIENALEKDIDNFKKLSETEKNFLIFNRIQNEFIYEYYENNLVLGDIKVALSNTNDLQIPISLNNCLTVENIIKNTDIKDFPELIFQKLNGLDELTTEINNLNYSLCFNKTIINQIDQTIFNYIKTITSADFDKFIYN